MCSVYEPGWMEQHQYRCCKKPFLSIEEIDAGENPPNSKEFLLTVTPPILILKGGIILERFEG
jgi:hypothetical protein